MKAAVISTLGAPPRVTSRPDPSPAAGDQVLIRVEATALNVIDLHVAAGHHRAGPPQLPYVPGLEAAGTIVAGPDQGLRVRAVAPAGLVPGVNGGLAELLLASRATCIPVPDGLDSVAAAAGDGGPFHVGLLRAAQLTLLGFSGTVVNPADAIASYHRVAALAADGSFALPTATYSLAGAAQAWAAQASSPGKKIVVIP